MKRSYSIFLSILMVAALNVSCGEEAPVKAKKPADNYVDNTSFDSNPAPATDTNFFDSSATGTTDPTVTGTDAGGLGGLLGGSGGGGGFADILSGFGSGSSDGTSDPNAGPFQKLLGFFSSFGGGNGLGDMFGG